MLYRLIFLNTDLKGQRITVDTAPMTIGRDPDCGIVLKDDEVSRKHALLEHKPEGLFIHDLGSMNRILVNNREVREKRLKHGDSVMLGRTKLLVQAVVRAEVSEVKKGARKKEILLTMFLFLLLLAVVGGVGYRFWRQVASVPAAQEAPAEPPVSAEEPEGVSEELTNLRKALTDIQATVTVLEQARPAAEAPGMNREDEAASTERVLLKKAEAILQEARGKVARGEWEEADRLLESVQVMTPGMLEAYEERARLYEKRGQLEKAIRQWVAIIQRDPAGPLLRKAVEERDRLGHVEGPLLPLEARDVRLAGIESYKFRKSEEVAEMRMLQIQLAPAATNRILEAGHVRVEVLFYDEDKATGAIAPTQAIAPADRLRLDPGEWTGTQQRTLTATYVAPKREGGASSSVFHGYRVRVFYQDRLQDQEARPKSLLEAAAPGHAE